MNLTSLKVFLYRNDVKIVIIGTVTNGILQILAKNTLKVIQNYFLFFEKTVLFGSKKFKKTVHLTLKNISSGLFFRKKSTKKAYI